MSCRRNTRVVAGHATRGAHMTMPPDPTLPPDPEEPPPHPGDPQPPQPDPNRPSPPWPVEPKAQSDTQLTYQEDDMSVQSDDRLPDAWSDERKRQYEYIKEGVLDRGEDEDTAEEIAARTVNKERAQAGEAETSSPLSREDMSASRRGGLRSHKGPGGRTYRQLYEEARQRKLAGRSAMNK